MIGAIIGDIVGSRFEFNNYRGTDFELFHPDCMFTDDTICTIAVAEWVINGGKLDFTSLLQKWCRLYPNPKGGYGGRFSQWISNPIPYNSYGNGAAMRISPVGYYLSPLEGLFKAVEMVTGVSHNHPEGIKGAKCIAYAIWHLRHGITKKWVKGMSETNYGYNLKKSCDEIRKTNRFVETCQVTVPQAITCFLESYDFESAIRLSVSIGGDSDTIAAITGSLAEAYYGVPMWMAHRVKDYLPKEMEVIFNKFNLMFG